MRPGTDQPFDSISLDEYTEACVLTLVAYAVWDASECLLLQERINRCLRAIESGEVFVEHPGSRGRDFIISVRSIYAPDQETLSFLTQARSILEDAGHFLRFGPLGSGYVIPDIASD
ncbi:MAG: hypothetical protein REI95_09140 [Oxalicibacterium faecigallinarum]|uniref:DUF6572 domain-containing protein n=1 Tax=Oxalicibacterium faecigallinarum TaxID=573741 RepID=UPI002809654F|nr:DUF6572 domain-containing protein [Oxalicibacterium faecigallinarum]MDQ7969793.1 hypothetical protein [Oxalicibacterium faecigallinarum]